MKFKIVFRSGTREKRSPCLPKVTCLDSDNATAINSRVDKTRGAVWIKRTVSIVNYTDPSHAWACASWSMYKRVKKSTFLCPDPVQKDVAGWLHVSRSKRVLAFNFVHYGSQLAGGWEQAKTKLRRNMRKKKKTERKVFLFQLVFWSVCCSLSL